MDIVHHTLLGGAGFLAAQAVDAPIVGAAFLAGSVLPDLDAAFMVFGKRFYLRHHQGITHALPLAPLYAALIGGGLALLPFIEWSWAMYLAALAGLLLHVGLDWLNTFRIGLFSPFSTKRYSVDAVFFIDATTLVLTGLFYFLYAAFGAHPLLWAYPVLFVAYLGLKVWLRRAVQRGLAPLYAIPSSVSPFHFYVLETRGDGLASYLFNALDGAKTHARYYPPVDEAHQALAETSPLFRDMARITRALRITDVREDESGTTLRADDVAVRNFGGRFGRTELRFDRDGKLINEVAHI